QGGRDCVRPAHPHAATGGPPDRAPGRAGGAVHLRPTSLRGLPGQRVRADRLLRYPRRRRPDRALPVLRRPPPPPALCPLPGLPPPPRPAMTRIEAPDQLGPCDLLAALGELDCARAALMYAALGFLVVPMHTAQPGGGCSCAD